MLQSFLNILGDLQTKSVNPYDNDYPQYRLPTSLNQERVEHSKSSELDSNKERAFSIANKAIYAICSNNLKEANEMSFQSYYLDPFCVDAWRMITYNLYVQHSDGSILINATRELLRFSRRFYETEFEKVGQFYTIPSTRPYIRILCDMAKAAKHGYRLDVATYSYEEILRLDHLDELNIHDPLLCCYLKLIGLSHQFPGHAIPVRTIEHAKELMNCIFYDTNDKNEPFVLFEENNITVRWANLCFLYLECKKNGDSEIWKNEAKKEYERNELIFKLIFDEISIPEIDYLAPKIPRHLQVHNKKTDLEMKGNLIKDFLKFWPDFLVDLYKLFKGEKVPESFMFNINTNNYVPCDVMPPFYKKEMKENAEKYLNEGRKNLSNRQFEKALESFIHSQVCYCQTIPEMKRWYLHLPFAIASNLATSAMNLERWNFFRIELRFTLKMKPDHEKSYLKLPKLAEVFKAVQLVEEFDNIALCVKEKNVKDIQQWKLLADKVIGLTSMTALAFAAANKLTDEMKDELIKIGIEDCYTTINVGSVHPVLPWLTLDDIEQPIPNE